MYKNSKSIFKFSGNEIINELKLMAIDELTKKYSDFSGKELNEAYDNKGILESRSIFSEDIGEIKSENIVENYRVIRQELEGYNPDLLNKYEVIALNKIDLLDSKELTKKVNQLKKFLIKNNNFDEM